MRASDLIWVFLGGGFGSVCRYGLSIFFLVYVPGYPWGTLLVNVLGSAAAGLLLGRFPDAGYPAWKLFLLTGFLGGFTTFSSFSLETLSLWIHLQRGLALLNMGANLAGSLIAVCLGFLLGRGLLD